MRLTQHELATRLSYLLWSSMPDESLAAAADAGQLETAQQIATASRACSTTRVRAKRCRSSIGSGSASAGSMRLGKDSGVHPEFTPALRAAMRAELPAFVEHVLWSADRRLAHAAHRAIRFRQRAAGGSVRRFGAGRRDAQLVTLDPAERAGRAHPGGVSRRARAAQPELAGAARQIRARARCSARTPPAPPPNLNVTPPEVDPIALDARALRASTPTAPRVRAATS